MNVLAPTRSGYMLGKFVLIWLALLLALSFSAGDTTLSQVQTASVISESITEDNGATSSVSRVIVSFPFDYDSDGYWQRSPDNVSRMLGIKRVENRSTLLYINPGSPLITGALPVTSTIAAQNGLAPFSSCSLIRRL